MLDVFKNLIENHLNRFINSYHQEPKMFFQLAKDIKNHGIALKNNPDRYQEAAIDIVNAMAKETYLINLFTQAIADEQIEDIKPGVILEKADNAPEIQSEDSKEILETVAYTIEEIEKAGEDFSSLYFENYFSEYVTSIFFVSTIESFYSQKDLFIQLKQFLDDKNQSEEIFNIFMLTSENLKEDLSKIYSFDSI